MTAATATGTRFAGAARTRVDLLTVVLLPTGFAALTVALFANRQGSRAHPARPRRGRSPD
ncbi:MAG: hypothetical protein ACRDSK_29090 [Actinophytocola sp.]|uniref:hypothetical protein n=1 Tax=Actinophytocola sp. TaxID=1872138 RepID=UPI003D6AEA00